jgi:hypothetical protein
MKKGIEINGEIKIFQSIPKNWGSVIGGFNYSSKSELEKFGFYDIKNSDGYDPNIHDRGELKFNKSKKAFIYSKSNKTWSESLADLKTNKKAEIKKLANLALQPTDWYVIRKAEGGKDIPSDVTTKREEIKSKADEREAEIDALTKKGDVVNYNARLFDPVRPEFGE